EGVDSEWAKAIAEIAKKNITPPEVQITGYVDLKSYAPEGVDIIKNALQIAEEDNVVIQCVGAPRYRLIVTSTDYIEAEKNLKKAAQKCIEVVESSEGEGTFYRELE
ncbi:MAG: translation initiation factor IF-2 subunit alpha, partial [Euryarchaeota archaeon]|nr:translation initiation factor IF-2 subunit alpha [Euryarchaeota archaeon]MBV1767846.1 translation initiation factor IF-2 subunit alpha [Methanobacterium sp.]